MPVGPVRMAGLGAPVRLAGLYGAVFVVTGIQLPFFPVWLRARGLSASEISAVLALGMVVRIAASPAMAYAADRSGQRRRPILALAVGSLAAYALFAICRDVWPIALVMLLASALFPSILPIADTLTLRLARERGLDYGRVRLWGSLTFIAASNLGGVGLDRAGPDFVLWAILAGCTATVLAACALPEVPVRAQEAVPPSFRAARGLVLNPVFLLFLFSASAIQASHGVYYAFGTLHWRHLGYSDSLIGALWGLGVIAEVLLFAVSNRVVARIGPLNLILLGSAAGIVRWGATALDPGLPILVPMQCLHALTFGATHLGAVHFLSRAVPAPLSATAQGLLSAMSAGIVLGLSTLASGWLYAAFGGRAYLAMALLAGLGGAGAWLVSRLWTGGVLSLALARAH